ncbi:MAG: hypothetical protein ABI743_09185, partial [bacterium]
PVISGQISREEYITHANHPALTIDWMNHHLTSDDRIFCLEDRLYRLEIPWTNYFAAKAGLPQTPQECMDYLARLGCTHLYLGEGQTLQPILWRNIARLPRDPDGLVRFHQADVMVNLQGEPIRATKHWVAWALFRRQAERAGLQSTTDALGGVEYTVDPALLLADPATAATVQVMDSLATLIGEGSLTVAYSDGLNLVLAVQPQAARPAVIP